MWFWSGIMFFTGGLMLEKMEYLFLSILFYVAASICVLISILRQKND